MDSRRWNSYNATSSRDYVCWNMLNMLNVRSVTQARDKRQMQSYRQNADSSTIKKTTYPWFLDAVKLDRFSFTDSPAVGFIVFPIEHSDSRVMDQSKRQQCSVVNQTCFRWVAEVDWFSGNVSATWAIYIVLCLKKTWILTFMAQRLANQHPCLIVCKKENKNT